MADNVTSLASVAYLNRDVRDEKVELIPATKAIEEVSHDAGRYRLTIEREPTGYIYRTRDRVTGEVISQFPREDVLKLRRSAAYDTGKIIKTQA